MPHSESSYVQTCTLRFCGFVVAVQTLVVLFKININQDRMTKGHILLSIVCMLTCFFVFSLFSVKICYLCCCRYMFTFFRVVLCSLLNYFGNYFIRFLSETLRNYFSQYGEVVDCVIMKDKTTNQSRGFGFVKFKDPNCVRTVLETKPHNLDGRNVSILIQRSR